MSEAIAAVEHRSRRLKLPDEAPAPTAKPQPPKAQTAKAPDRKDSEKPAKEAAAKPKSDEKEFDADEVAALLNKEKPSGGGAKRSTETGVARRRQDDQRRQAVAKRDGRAARPGCSAAGTFRPALPTPGTAGLGASSGSTRPARSKAARK